MSPGKDLYHDFVTRAWQNNTITTANLELTYDCNLKCSFCYNPVIYKNAVTFFDESLTFTSLSANAGDRETQEGFAIIELDEDDFVEMWFMNGDSGEDIANVYVTMCIREI